MTTTENIPVSTKMTTPPNDAVAGEGDVLVAELKKILEDNILHCTISCSWGAFLFFITFMIYGFMYHWQENTTMNNLLDYGTMFSFISMVISLANCYLVNRARKGTIDQARALFRKKPCAYFMTLHYLTYDRARQALQQLELEHQGGEESLV